MGTAESRKASEHTFLDSCGKRDQEVAVRKALEKHPDLAQCSDTREYWEGFTALHYAAYSGSGKVVQLLLDEHDAEVNVQNRIGSTPLHYACINGDEEVAQLLLEHGADVNVQNESGWAPLHFAAFHGRGEVVRVLLEHAAVTVELGVQEQHDWTALHYASLNGHEDVVRVLLEHGADVDAQNRHGRTPLYNACSNNKEAVVRLLLYHGADRSIKTNDGETVRVAAERCNVVSIVELLDSHYPVKLQVVEVLLGMKGPTPSPLTRFGAHSTYEPQVLSLVKCLLSGEESVVFDQLQRDARRYYLRVLLPEYAQ